MNRRDSLKGMGLVLGGSVLSRSVFAEFIQAVGDVKNGAKWTPQFIPVEHATVLPELVETIIPATDTPGAKEALVYIFVDIYLRDCYPKEQQEVFLKGLGSIDDISRRASNLPFLQLPKENRLALLIKMERESWASNEPLPASFIKMLKHLTLLGFYSSKLGATQAAVYELNPGPFEGCIDLKPGQKADAMS